MELKQIYEQMQGDYYSVLGRLGTEERVKKYLLKFMDKNMDKAILDALEEKDYERAFREAHSLKGVCANLNMDKLEKSASDLTEELRGGAPKGDITAYVQAVQSDYDMTLCALKHLND